MSTTREQHGAAAPAGDGRGGGRGGGRLIPGAYSRRFARVFGWYVERRLFARRFHAVRVVRETVDAATALADYPGPVIVLLNHPSWWDPLAAALIGYRYFLGRTVAAPIDAEQLEKFRFFRRLGLFGIDPDDAASLGAMVDYVGERFRTERRPTLWITAQGHFTDVRTPVRIRPGAAAIAAGSGDVRVLAAALEYTFWNDAKPELFIRFERCAAPEGTTTDWLRAMNGAMQRNQEELAALVAARDAAPFESIVGGDAPRINPVYDAWLRARGRSAGIETQRRAIGGARAGREKSGPSARGVAL